ncbi:MAG: serine hydrolase [Pseudomonadota bacterium]
MPWSTFVERDLGALGDLEPWIELEPNAAERTVSGRILGMTVTTATYHEGYGCVANGSRAAALDKYLAEATTGGMPLEDAKSAFPRLNALVSEEFDRNPDSVGEGINHRSFIMLHKGRLITEHYAAPFDASTRFPSQSMAKSVNALLWAAADMRGLLDLDGPVAAPEWHADDPRQAITNRHLLDMTSGLDFDENYDLDLFGQFTKMIFSGDIAGFAAQLDLAYTPGERWYYSTADSNLSGRTLGLKLEESGYSVHGFAHEALFGKIATDPVELQVDDAGSFWAGSFVRATTRDWARIGQLILDDGVYDGERLLPADFVRTLGEPLPASSGRYRSSMWLNQGLNFGQERQLAPGLPDETISFNGFQGQRVHIIPATDFIIVRKGRTEGPGAADAYKKFIAEAYALALEELESVAGR